MEQYLGEIRGSFGGKGTRPAPCSSHSQARPPFISVIWRGKEDDVHAGRVLTPGGGGCVHTLDKEPQTPVWNE